VLSIRASISNNDIEVELDMRRAAEPRGGRVGMDADRVVARLVRSEGEAPLRDTMNIRYNVIWVNFLIGARRVCTVKRTVNDLANETRTVISI
jgi:hypothetical protein